MTYYTSLGMTGANWIVPKAYVEKVGADGFKKQPIGAGPYKFVRFTAGVELVLEAFEDYWRKVPNVKTLRFRIIPEGSTRLAMLKTGEIDVAYVMEGALTDGILADPKLKFVAIRTAAVRYLIPTEQWDPKSPWSDLRVRQAASLALDRKTIMEARNPGGAIPGGIMPDDLKWALRIEPDPYDLGRAKSLLAAAGYPSGVDAGMLIGDVAYGDLLDVTATYWKAAGINVTVRKMERVAYGAALSAKSVRGVLLDLTSAGTAAERLERVLVTLAYGHYPDIDALMAQQAKEVDPKKREALLHDIQRLIKAKEMIIPTYNTTNPSGVGPRVKESNLARAPVPVWWSVPYEDVELAK